MYTHCQEKGEENHDDLMFNFGRQCSRVTTSVESREFGDIKVIDTPGTNDFSEELSDYDIQKMKHRFLNQLFADKNKGVSCVLQCVMLDSGGRLKQTSIDSMIRTLHSLTYSYPSYSPEAHGGPILNVVFTGFSQLYGEEDISGIPGHKSEAIHD